MLCAFFSDTINPDMEQSNGKRSRGRPPKDPDSLHTEPLLVRLEATEKEAFREAAELAGMPLSRWVRERLSQVAARELKRAAHPIPFRLTER